MTEMEKMNRRFWLRNFTKIYMHMYMFIFYKYIYIQKTPVLLKHSTCRLWALSLVLKLFPQFHWGLWSCPKC